MIKIEPHTADVRILIKANTINELLQEAMLGIYTILQPVGKRQAHRRKKLVHLTGKDQTVMLVDFMNEILTDSLTNRYVYDRIFKSDIKENEWNIVVEGYQVRSYRYDVKAVTYHEADIIRTEDGRLQTIVIMDI